MIRVILRSGFIMILLSVTVAQADTKICPQCGTVNWIDAKFCKDCGYEFGTNEPTVSPEPEDTRTLEEVLQDATQAFNAKKWEEALEHYERLIELDPGNVLAKEKASECRENITEEKKRREAMEKATREKEEYDSWRTGAMEQRNYHTQTAKGLLETGKVKEAGKYILPAFAGDYDWKPGRELLKEALEKSDWSDDEIEINRIFDELSLAEKYEEELKAGARSLCNELLSGQLVLEISEPNATVYLDGGSIGSSPIEPYDIRVGEYEIKVKKTGFHEATKTFEVIPGKTTTVAIDLTPTIGYATITSQPDKAEVFTDGESRGHTPLDRINISSGLKQVRLEKRLHEPWEDSMEIRDGKTSSLNALLHEKTKQKALMRSALLPGAGQRYRERTGIGWTYTVIQFVAIGAAAYTYSSYSSALDDYDSARDAFVNATTGHEDLWDDMEVKHRDAGDARSTANLIISVALGIYIWNLVDALVF